MTHQDPQRSPELVAIQRLTARGGFNYGVLKGDLHVYGTAPPSYVLAPGPAIVPPRSAVGSPGSAVGSPGSAPEADGRTPPRYPWPRTRLAALLLYGPDAVATSAAAAGAATEAAASGWMLLAARLTRGGRSSTDPIPEPGHGAGVLVLVEGSDEWSFGDLTWLFSNAILHQWDMPARVLLVATGIDRLPSIRAAVSNFQVSIRSLLVTPPKSDLT